VLQCFALYHGIRLFGVALCIMLGVLFCATDIALHATDIALHAAALAMTLLIDNSTAHLSFATFTFVEKMEKQSTGSIGESVHWWHFDAIQHCIEKYKKSTCAIGGVSLVVALQCVKNNFETINLWCWWWYFLW